MGFPQGVHTAEAPFAYVSISAEINLFIYWFYSFPENFMLVYHVV